MAQLLPQLVVAGLKKGCGRSSKQKAKLFMINLPLYCVTKSWRAAAQVHSEQRT